MKAMNILKKNKLLLIVALAYVVVLILSPEKALRSVQNSIYYLLEMLQVLPVIFLLTVVLEALVPKEMIIRGFGEQSGIRGNLLALLLGSISAGPIYAAFPISKALLGKGASIPNIVIILSAWAVIKVPMLANEAKFLGLKFMAIRWVLTVAAIFIMAYLIGIVVKKKDLPTVSGIKKAALLEIREEYCVSCGLCAELLPNYCEMKNNKASVKLVPDGKTDRQEIREAIEKCPVQAITLNEETES